MELKYPAQLDLIGKRIVPCPKEKTDMDCHLLDVTTDAYPPNKGFVHVYTGEGKGKTTAAFGIALRSAGAGYRVFIGQFMKGVWYCELEAFARFTDLIMVKQ